MRFNKATLIIGTAHLIGVRSIKITTGLPSMKLNVSEPKVFTPPKLNNWSLSGILDLPDDTQAYLKKWLKPSRLPRKLKKRIKADIHRFFIPQNRYKISPLINWQKRFNIK